MEVFCIKISIEKIRNVMGITSLILIPVVPITFSIYGSQYKVLTYINYGILFICLFVFVWGYFYYEVSPSWVGVFLTLLHILSVILLLFLAKWFHIPDNNLLALPLSVVVGLIVYLFKDKIVNILVSLFHK